MRIKPLEKKSRSIVVLKFIFLISLMATGFLFDRFFVTKNNDIPSVLGKTEILNKIAKEPSKDIFQDSVKKTHGIGESILGETTNFIQDATDKISSSVSDLIYENTFSKIVDQVGSLPKDQQDRIKEQLCR